MKYCSGAGNNKNGDWESCIKNRKGFGSPSLILTPSLDFCDSIGKPSALKLVM
jgi:hypothetical protein